MARNSRITRPGEQRTLKQSVIPAFGSWLVALRFPLALALLPFLLYLPLTLVRATFYVHDIQYYFYAYHALSANLVRSGTLPLWNPYAFGGIPLLGDGQTAMFYPPNWLFFLLPGAAALNYVMLLQFSIAGVGMYLCARGFGLHRWPACVSALAFMFCGMMTARVVHLSIMSGVALIPWLVFAVDRAFGASSGFRMLPVGMNFGPAGWFVFAALMAALHVVAGHPQVPVYTAVALGVLALVRAREFSVVRRSWKPLLEVPLRLAGIYVLGYALAAIQLVPWVELGAASPRAAETTFEFVMGSGAAGTDWLLWLFPYVYGALQTGLFASSPMALPVAVRAWEHSDYVGVPTLALALVGIGALGELSVRLFRGRSSTAAALEDTDGFHRWYTLLFLLLILALGLFTGAGKYTPFSQIVYATPVVGKLRAVERALVLAAFALPLLAGFGFQWLVEQHGRALFARWTAAIAGVLIAATTVFSVWFAAQPGSETLLRAAPGTLQTLALNRANAVIPLVLAIATLVLLVGWAVKPQGKLASSLLVALLLADMAIYTTNFNPTTAPDFYAYQPQVLQALDGDGQPFRKATVLIGTNDLPPRAAQETLAVSWGMVYGVEDMNGFNSLQPRRYTDYVFGTQVKDVSYAMLQDPQLFLPESPILSSLNVRYVLVPAGGPQPQLGPQLQLRYTNSEVYVYENTLVWPRAFFTDQARIETDPQVVLRTVTAPGFDARRESLVESSMPPLAASNRPASVEITRYEPNQIELQTQTTESRLLVLSEMYFPGWRASIDGVEAPIERTNYLFRGVVVPAGQHTVSFSYRPLSALIGLLISALAAVVALLIVFVSRWRQRATLTGPAAETGS